MHASNPDEFEGEQLLASLREVPARSAQAAASGRASFLSEASHLKPAVPAPPEPRHKRWIHIFSRKEPIHMTTLASIFLIVTLLFGGAGATVVAAQDSAPGQVLYPVKMVSEDAQLAVTTRAQSRLDLVLQYSNRRAAEIAGQLQAGQQPQTQAAQRWQRELQQALSIAAGLPDSDVQPALLKIRQAVQDQQRLMDQIALTGSPETDRQHIQAMLRDCQALVAAGLQDPVQFRQRGGQGRGNETIPAQPSQAVGGGNPWTTGTPTPGSGYGPGGQNPWTTGTPTPGSGYGPGPGPGPYATSNPEPGPNNPGPGNPDPAPNNPDPGPNNPNPGPGTGGNGKRP